VYVCPTGDRGRCPNAGEGDPLLGQSRLIRRCGEISGALRRRRGLTRVKFAQPRPCGIESTLPRHCSGL